MINIYIYVFYAVWPKNDQLIKNINSDGLKFLCLSLFYWYLLLVAFYESKKRWLTILKK